MSELVGVSYETWAVIFGGVTSLGILTAGSAAVLAWRQLAFTRGAHLDRSRPYVVVALEPAPTTYGAIDFVIRNVGAGPAHDVRVTSDPPLRRAKPEKLAGSKKHPSIVELCDSRLLNESIPLIPPGQEVRVFFDYMSDRCKLDAPEDFSFTATYGDGRGHSWSDPSRSDLGFTHELTSFRKREVHDAAVALEKIEEHLRNADRSARVRSRADSVRSG